MNTLLTDLYNDNFSIRSTDKEQDSETRELLRLICCHEEALHRALSEEQRDIFRQFEDCCSELQSKEEKRFFIRGFRLGVRLMLEALSSE